MRYILTIIISFYSMSCLANGSAYYYAQAVPQQAPYVPAPQAPAVAPHNGQAVYQYRYGEELPPIIEDQDQNYVTPYGYGNSQVVEPAPVPYGYAPAQQPASGAYVPPTAPPAVPQYYDNDRDYDYNLYYDY